MDRIDDFANMRSYMFAIREIDLVIMHSLASDNTNLYDARYKIICLAIGEAANVGIEVGFDYDHEDVSPDEILNGKRVVVTFNLPTGNVSWHMRQGKAPYDGHSTREKLDRIQLFCESFGS